jgi:hypothetical protein
MDSPIWGITTSIRANGSTSRWSSRPNVTTTQPRQDQHRQRDSTDQRAHGRVHVPITERQAVARRRTANSFDDLPDQYRDHSAAPEPDEGREAADPNIAGNPVFTLDRPP